MVADARNSSFDSELEEVVANLDQLVETDLEACLHAVGADHARQRLRKETSEDPVSRKVLLRINQGWDRDDKKDPDIRPFFLAPDSLCLIQDVLLLNDRVVIPSSMRSSILEQLHGGHPGIRRMKSLARLHFFWPAMSSDIEQAVRECPRCIDTAAKPVKVPLTPWPNAGKLRSRVHIDFGEPTKGRVFVVVVDSVLKYKDAQWLPSLATTSLMTYLKQLSRHFGRPDTIVSDNGAQFT